MNLREVIFKELDRLRGILVLVVVVFIVAFSLTTFLNNPTTQHSLNTPPSSSVDYSVLAGKGDIKKPYKTNHKTHSKANITFNPIMFVL